MKVETPIGEQTLNAGESVRCDENKIGPVQEKEELPEVLGYEDDPAGQCSSRYSAYL